MIPSLLPSGQSSGPPSPQSPVLPSVQSSLLPSGQSPGTEGMLGNGL